MDCEPVNINYNYYWSLFPGTEYIMTNCLGKCFEKNPDKIYYEQLCLANTSFIQNYTQLNARLQNELSEQSRD